MMTTAETLSPRLINRVHIRTPRLSTIARTAFLALAVVLMVRMVRNGWSDIAEAARLLATSKLGLVAIAIACEAAWTWTLAQVYRSSLMAMGGTVRNRDALRVSMGAFSLSRILPGGGAVGSVFAARELMAVGNSGTVTLASMVVSWWISMVTLSTLVLAGIATGSAVGIVSPAYLLAPAITLAALLAVGGIGMLAVRRPGLRAKILGIAHKACRDIGTGEETAERTFITAVKRLNGGRGLIKVSLWAGASWALDAAALWAIFDAFGHRVPVSVLVVGYGAANLLQALPELTPGWLGVLETTMSVTYAAFGVPAGIAVVAVLAYRFVSFWLPVAVGMPWGISILRRNGTAAPAAVALAVPA